MHKSSRIRYNFVFLAHHTCTHAHSNKHTHTHTRMHARTHARTHTHMGDEKKVKRKRGGRRGGLNMFSHDGQYHLYIICMFYFFLKSL